MTSWSFVRIFAGLMILVSLALGLPGSPVFVSQYWLLFTAFVGVNLLQSGFTKWCPLEIDRAQARSVAPAPERRGERCSPACAARLGGARRCRLSSGTSSPAAPPESSPFRAMRPYLTAVEIRYHLPHNAVAPWSGQSPTGDNS